MPGVWFAATIAFLVASGVIAQLGWQLPEKVAVKRVFRRDRLRSAQPSAGPSAAVAGADRR